MDPDEYFVSVKFISIPVICTYLFDSCVRHNHFFFTFVMDALLLEVLRQRKIKSKLVKEVSCIRTR